MFCASLLAGRPFWQMPYGAQPHRDEGCFASAIEMRWTGIMSVSSLKNHWSSYCSLLLFRFELRSLPWIHLADITRFRTRNLNWIERSRLFCYSVINLLYRTLFGFLLLNCKSFCILSHQLSFVKNFFLFVYPKTSEWKVLCCHKTAAFFSQATLIFYHADFHLSRTFFFYFNFLFKRNSSLLQLVYVIM